METVIFNRERKTFQLSWFNILIDQKDAEKYLRDQYPAVQEAFEKYSMLLHLVSQNGNIGN